MFRSRKWGMKRWRDVEAEGRPSAKPFPPEVDRAFVSDAAAYLRRKRPERDVVAVVASDWPDWARKFAVEAEGGEEEVVFTDDYYSQVKPREEGGEETKISLGAFV